MQRWYRGTFFSNFEFKFQKLYPLVQDKGGVTAIEYALIAALIAVAAIGAFTVVGTDLSTTFSTIASCL